MKKSVEVLNSIKKCHDIFILKECWTNNLNKRYNRKVIKGQTCLDCSLNLKELNLTLSSVAAQCQPGRNSGRCVSYDVHGGEPAGWDGGKGRDCDGSHMCARTPDIVAGGWISSSSGWQRCALWVGASRTWGRGGDKLIRCVFTLGEDIW